LEVNGDLIFASVICKLCHHLLKEDIKRITPGPGAPAQPPPPNSPWPSPGHLPGVPEGCLSLLGCARDVTACVHTQAWTGKFILAKAARSHVSTKGWMERHKVMCTQWTNTQP
jgi:hypothetical protein